MEEMDYKTAIKLLHPDTATNATLEYAQKYGPKKTADMPDQASRLACVSMAKLEKIEKWLSEHEALHEK